MDEEDPGEGRLVGEEGEIRPARGAEQVLIASPVGQRPGRGHDAGDHELPALAGRGQEALLLVGEVGVEGGPGQPGPPHDVGDGDGRVAGLGHRGDHRVQQPLPLRRADGPRRQAAPAARKARLALVRPGERPPLPGFGHRFTVSGMTLKYGFVL